ncbi:hypothetical protein L2K70_09580 [Nocardioides KLBMP 9356]|uniref:Uncharacterized protein n=1 Tax=Nocardioides potassii TaxID=2911371 RepID=A0ABS9HC91_9ACTN|nr:hypothetical protein [Nocardioides potassii]MCF6377855.1 hypothetical protein [Nocardioides potassii]
MWRAVPGGVLLALLALTGCGSDGTGDLDDSAAWRTSTDPLDPTGLVWASGQTVHLQDGTTVDVGADIAQFAVAGDGIFFFEATGDDRGDDLRDAPLLYGEDGSDPVDTGLDVDGDMVAASPDGTHLAAIVVNDDDTGATVTIFDLTSGEVVRSSDGMRPGSDPEDEFLEAELSVLGIDDDDLYGRSLDGDFAWSLSTGEGREADPSALLDPLASPNGAWTIETKRDGTVRTVASPGGERVRLQLPEGWRSYLSAWADGSTAVGVSVKGGASPELDPGDTVRLLTCQVPDGTCEVRTDVPDGTVLLPMRGDTGQAYRIQTGRTGSS